VFVKSLCCSLISRSFVSYCKRNCACRKNASGVDVDTPLIKNSCLTYSEEESVELTERSQPTCKDQISPMPIISREHIEEEAFEIVD